PSTSLVPGIHVLLWCQRKSWMASEVGLARLPYKDVPQVGYIRLAVSSPAMTIERHFAVSLLEHTRTELLPPIFTRWFASRGWQPRAHQLELLAKARTGRSVLLIAPTGGGKTLAGFLPSLVELHAQGAAAVSVPNRRLMSTGRGIGREGGLHTLYVSPLKALGVDIARNLE